jgi:hypothetical protein
LRVLVACEFSGTVRDAFIARGHDAISCDLLPTESPGPHIVGDVLTVLRDEWDLVIAHPPCTYLANSGVCWLFRDADRWKALDAGAVFFRACLDANAQRVCVENPIQHQYARERIGVDYAQIIQPWQFGHGETKATCLWLRGLPPLMATSLRSGREQRLHKLPPSADRWKERSKTYKGIAEAMAAQWGAE